MWLQRDPHLETARPGAVEVPERIGVAPVVVVVRRQHWVHLGHVRPPVLVEVRVEAGQRAAVVLVIAEAEDEVGGGRHVGGRGRVATRRARLDVTHRGDLHARRRGRWRRWRWGRRRRSHARAPEPEPRVSGCLLGTPVGTEPAEGLFDDGDLTEAAPYELEPEVSAARKREIGKEATEAVARVLGRVAAEDDALTEGKCAGAAPRPFRVTVAHP